jgi:hypothetical protein
MSHVERDSVERGISRRRKKKVSVMNGWSCWCVEREDNGILLEKQCCRNGRSRLYIALSKDDMRPWHVVIVTALR